MLLNGQITIYERVFQSRNVNVKAEMSTTTCGKICRKSDNIHVRSQLGVIPGLQPSGSFINYKRSSISLKNKW